MLRPLRDCASDQARICSGVMSPSTLLQAWVPQFVRGVAVSGPVSVPPAGKCSAPKAKQLRRSAVEIRPLLFLSANQKLCTAAPVAVPLQAMLVLLSGHTLTAAPFAGAAQPLSTTAAVLGCSGAGATVGMNTWA